MQINSYIDHTLLKPTVLITEIQQLCAEAIKYSFAAVCVPPPVVVNARKELEGSPVKTATVIGFPFGYSTGAAKKAEVAQAIRDGADELDMVINLLALKNNAWKYLESEIGGVTRVAREHKKIIKIIIESGMLNDEEIIRCCEICTRAGVDFVKTSTGYAEKGATVEAVKLMRAHLPTEINIKASGGIRTYAFAAELVEAGATRLGCSASIAIVEGSDSGPGGY